MTTGSTVLFLPKSIKRWNKRCLMLGKVVKATRDVVVIEDITGKKHTEYIRKVMVIRESTAIQ